MRAISGICLLIVLSFAAAVCSAAVFRVPDDYLTIQSALDQMEAEDTVLVAIGTYAEALTAPPFSFSLLGDVNPDTGDYPRPVIDPTSVPGSDSLACLVLPLNSSATIERFEFVNGTGMYPRRESGWFPGGICYYTNEPVWIRECFFDSVFGAIDYRDLSAHMRLTVENCHFHDMTYGTIVSRGPAHIVDCLFDGNSLGGSGGRDSIVFERCLFRGNITLGWIGLYGPGGVVRDCVFGPGICGAFPLQVFAHASNLIEDNLFTDIGLSGGPIDIMCRGDDTVIVRGNTFTGNYLHQYQHAPIRVQDDDAVTDSALRVIFEENTLVDCEGTLEGLDLAKCLEFWTMLSRTETRRNRFVRNLPQSAPVAMSDTLGYLHTFRENLFEDNAYALRAQFESVDARWNWWGDASGPYHPVLNPVGQGDAVSDSVLFDPWYADTSFLSVPGLGKPLPESFVFEAYPNPFNNVIIFRLTPPEAMIVRVELFDILGRRVREIWSGPLAFQKQITFDATDLASGIYFARIWRPIGNREMALTKLVLLK